MRTREFVRYGDVAIEVIVEGQRARDRAAAVARARFRGLRRGRGRARGGGVSRAAAAAARDRQQHRADDGHFAARPRARRRRGDQGAGRRQGRDRRTRLRQLGGAHDGGRSSRAGARRRHRRGRGQAIPARACGRDQCGRQSGACPRTSASRRCASRSSRRATIRRHGSTAGIRTCATASARRPPRSSNPTGGPPASAPLLDLQAANDPFKPPEKRNEMKDEFGDRVTVAVVAGREPRAHSGAAEGRGRGARRLGEDAAVMPADRLRWPARPSAGIPRLASHASVPPGRRRQRQIRAGRGDNGGRGQAGRGGGHRRAFPKTR